MLFTYQYHNLMKILINSTLQILNKIKAHKNTQWNKATSEILNFDVLILRMLTCRNSYYKNILVSNER